MEKIKCDDCGEMYDPSSPHFCLKADKDQKSINNEQQRKDGEKWPSILGTCIGIIIVIFFVFLFSHGSVAPISQPPPPIPPETSFCTSFDYTRWSHCAADGTQSRVITAAYPDGCTLTDSAPVVQQQKCQYVSVNPSATDIINKMVGQIHDAPDQTITTQYFSGQSGDIYITTNKWKLSSDGEALFLEGTSKSRATGVITDHIILADTNKDFRPDEYSDNGDNWYSLASQEPALVQNYTTVWAVASAYFGVYLLNY